MKKLDTLEKIIAKAEADTNALAKLVTEAKTLAESEALAELEALEKNEILAILEYAELKKALDNKNYTLLLDINFEKCKSEDINLNVFSLIDTHNKRAIHLYRKNNSCFDLSLASDKNTLEKLQYFEALKTDYTLKHKYKKDKTVKDTYLYKVEFDKVFDACKLVLAILESNIADLQKVAEAEAEQIN